MPEPTKQNYNLSRMPSFHSKLRAEDWMSPLIARLTSSTVYADGTAEIDDSYRGEDVSEVQSSLTVSWEALKPDFDRCLNTYQVPVVTEFAALGLAAVLTHVRAGLEITEVTRRGDRADYWLGDREFLLEVSGAQTGDISKLKDSKADQLRDNPFEKNGYVCVAVFENREAHLWFYSVKD